MTITTTITFKGYGIITFSDPVLGMKVFSDIISKGNVPYLEFRYSKDYPMQGVFSFKDLFMQNGWQYINILGNEVFVNYRKDMPRKFVKEVSYYLQLNLTSYEESYNRAD